VYSDVAQEYNIMNSPNAIEKTRKEEGKKTKQSLTQNFLTLALKHITDYQDKSTQHIKTQGTFLHTNQNEI
jgi:hypothetical protein